MTITQEQLDTAAWGTGYGSRRHLIDHETSRLRVPTPWGYSHRITARCARGIRIDAAIDTRDPRGLLARREPCVKCQKLADAEAGQ